jgi:hypothetical protein
MFCPTKMQYRRDLVNFTRLIGCTGFSFCYHVQQRDEGDGLICNVDVHGREIDVLVKAEGYPGVVRDGIQACCTALRDVLLEANETLDDPKEPNWDELGDCSEVPDHIFLSTFARDAWERHGMDPDLFPTMPTGSIFKQFDRQDLTIGDFIPLRKQIIAGSKCGNGTCPNRNSALRLKVCAACRAKLPGQFCARYCSKGCQKADWPRHKVTCGTNQYLEWHGPVT